MTIATTFASDMNRVLAFLELSVSTFDLAKVNLSRFRSVHPLAVAARDVHAKARAIPVGLSLACEGAFLSACAQFEQGVRDLIEEAATQAVGKKARFSLLPARMQDEHIDGCGKILQNITQDKFKHLTAAGVVASLNGCLCGGAGPYSLVVEAFSSNERNFKPNIISEHVGKLGLKGLWGLLSNEACLQAHFGSTSPIDTERFARERLERIMDKRNTIIHRGRGFAAPSEAEVKECCSFFSATIEALARVLIAYVASL